MNRKVRKIYITMLTYNIQSAKTTPQILIKWLQKDYTGTDRVHTLYWKIIHP